MATFKNNTGTRQTVARDGIEYHVAEGATVEIPDEDESFDGRPGWAKSAAKSPDVILDPDAPIAPVAPTN